MSEVVSIILAVGTLVPLLVSLVLQRHWSKRVRTTLMLVVTVLAGAAAYVAQFGLDVSSPSKIVGVIVGVVLASSAAYKVLWQPSGVTDSLEGATSKKEPQNTEIEPADPVVDAPLDYDTEGI